MMPRRSFPVALVPAALMQFFPIRKTPVNPRIVPVNRKHTLLAACLAQLLIMVLVVVALPVQQHPVQAQNNPLQDALNHARAAEKLGGKPADLGSARRAMEDAQRRLKTDAAGATTQMFAARDLITQGLEGTANKDSFRNEAKAALADLEKAISAAGGYQLVTESAYRLRIVTFTTPYGLSDVYFPGDAGAGEMISITRAIRTQRSPADQKRLLEYSAAANGNPISTGDSATRLILPQANSLDLKVKNHYDAEVAHIGIPLPLSPSDKGATGDPQGFYVPGLVQAGAPLVIVGPFDGDASNTHIRINGQEAKIIAESPRMVALLAPTDVTGPIGLELQEKERVASGSIYAASLSLTADNLHLLTGQGTNIRFTLSGLGGYTRNVPLVIENHSPSVISLPNETISVPSTQIGPTGSTTISRQVTSMSGGSFNVTATIPPDQLTKLSTGDSTRISTPVVTGTAQTSQFAGIPTTVKITMTSTGLTTGAIGQITVDNKSWRPVDVYLEPGIILSPVTFQSYVVPLPTDFTVPPGGTMTAPIKGYCTDVHLPAVPEGKPLPTFIIPKPTENIIVPVKLPVLPSGTVIVPTYPGTNVPVSSPETKPYLILDAASLIIPTYDRLKSEGLITTPFASDPAKEKESVIQQTIWIFTGQTGPDKYKKEDLQQKLGEQYTASTGKPVSEAPPAVRDKIKEGADSFWNTFTLVGREAKVIRTPETEKTSPASQPAVSTRKCLRQPVLPDIDNGYGWDVFSELVRNPARGKKPSVGFELNDIRYGYRDKVAAAEALLKEMETMLAGFLSSDEKYELANEKDPFSRHYKLVEFLKRMCAGKGTRVEKNPVFPEFPLKDFYLEIDLCDPATKDKKTLAEFVSPNANTGAVDQWYKDLGKAYDDLGFGGYGPEWPGRAGTQRDAARNMKEISDAYQHFADEMFVAMNLNPSVTKDWNNLLKGIITDIALVATAGLAAPGLALAGVGANLTGFVFSHGLESMGADPLAAALVGALLSLGLGAAAGSGTIAARLGDQLVDMAKVDLPAELANAALQKQVQNVILSMAVLDDRLWDQIIAKLGNEYKRGQGISRFQAIRKKLKDEVAGVLNALCGSYNELSQAVPLMQASLEFAMSYASSDYWRRQYYKESEQAYFNCPCCQWEGEPPRSGGCKFTVPRRPNR